MSSLKRATKACLRPLYRRLVKPLCRPLLTRLREFLTPPPGPATLESVQRDVWAAHYQLQALAALTDQLVRMAGEFGRRLDHFEGAAQETDRMLLSLLKVQPQEGDAGGRGLPFGALYVGGGRLLATHPHWPFIYLDAADPVATPRALTHTHEQGVRRALERLVKPGATVVEVGAGQGYHTLTLAALVGPGGRILAFEPEPRAASLLRQTLVCNGLEHLVRLIPPTAGAPSVAVTAGHVGEVLAAEGVRPDVIRLDAGGAAASALEGMWACLEAAPHVKLLFPFCAAALRRAGRLSPDTLLARLTDLRLKFWSVGEDGVFTSVGPGELLERGGEVVAARALE